MPIPLTQKPIRPLPQGVSLRRRASPRCQYSAPRTRLSILFSKSYLRMLASSTKTQEGNFTEPLSLAFTPPVHTAFFITRGRATSKRGQDAASIAALARAGLGNVNLVENTCERLFYTVAPPAQEIQLKGRRGKVLPWGSSIQSFVARSHLTGRGRATCAVLVTDVFTLADVFVGSFVTKFSGLKTNSTRALERLKASTQRMLVGLGYCGDEYSTKERSSSTVSVKGKAGKTSSCIVVLCLVRAECPFVVGP